AWGCIKSRNGVGDLFRIPLAIGGSRRLIVEENRAASDVHEGVNRQVTWNLKQFEVNILVELHLGVVQDWDFNPGEIGTSWHSDIGVHQDKILKIGNGRRTVRHNRIRKDKKRIGKEVLV